MNPIDLKPLRSALFVPLTDERFLAKAHERGADALLLDLEDSVPPAQKVQARARLGEAARRLMAAGAKVMVRVNSDAQHLADDLKTAAQARVAAVFLPKVENAEQVKAASFLLDGCDAGIVAMLESPASVLDAAAISRAGGRRARHRLGQGGARLAGADGRDGGARPRPGRLRPARPGFRNRRHGRVRAPAGKSESDGLHRLHLHPSEAGR